MKYTQNGYMKIQMKYVPMVISVYVLSSHENMTAKQVTYIYTSWLNNTYT